jgi:predicted membrane protein
MPDLRVLPIKNKNSLAITEKINSDYFFISILFLILFSFSIILFSISHIYFIKSNPI